MEFLKELWLYLKTRKRYWLIPLFISIAGHGIADCSNQLQCPGAHYFILYFS